MEYKLVHRKESLIITTIDTINEIGIQGLSTREIAKRQGVSEATIFRHYKSKNELLIAVLDFYSKFDSDIAKSTQLKYLSPREAIEFWLNSYVEYYENYPAITSIDQLCDTLTYDSELSDRAKEIFDFRGNVLKELINQAKKTEGINTEANSEHLADIILGYIKFNCLKWRLSNFNFSLKNSTMSTLAMILDMFKL